MTLKVIEKTDRWRDPVISTPLGRHAHARSATVAASSGG